MHSTTTSRFLLVAAIATLFGVYESTAQEETGATTAPVVFVCEHGNVKSLIGASLFDKVAKERGLPFRAVSRGLMPEESVPPKIAEALRGEGVEVAGFTPQRLSLLDVTTAARVVAIGVDLSSFNGEARVPTEVWSDVPPASVDYAAARAALLQHVTVLLDDLQAER